VFLKILKVYMKKISKGSVVTHRMKNLQVLNYEDIYYPRESGIVLEAFEDFFIVFWKDLGIQKEKKYYLDLVE
tara:strand:- start:306 stop:524 length:219 start_codon:yes stop_codon:yes gene_type:complete